jgi:hypothetical protein
MRAPRSATWCSWTGASTVRFEGYVEGEVDASGQHSLAAELERPPPSKPASRATPWRCPGRSTAPGLQSIGCPSPASGGWLKGRPWCRCVTLPVPVCEGLGRAVTLIARRGAAAKSLRPAAHRLPCVPGAELIVHSVDLHVGTHRRQVSSPRMNLGCSRTSPYRLADHNTATASRARPALRRTVVNGPTCPPHW